MTELSINRESYPLTVVIATLGGDTLRETIETINRGSVVPEEILVCIPENEACKVNDFAYENVKIIVTSCRGQVAQRVSGFQRVSHDIVMQLDDDIFLDEHCIKNLLDTLKTCGRKVAVAPALMDMATGESVYKKPGGKPLFQKIYYWLMNGADGYQPGKVDKSGAGVGIDPAREGKEQCDVEWLAGGCAMHHRENLVLESYYPFTGKAYFEDVVHSYHLRQKGVNLKVDTRARCWLETVSTSKFGHSEFVKFLMADYRDRKYAVRLYSRSMVRMHFYYIMRYLSYLYKRVGGSL